MNTPSALSTKTRRSNAGFTVMLGLLMMFALQTVRADIPDRARSSATPPQLSGMYKVAGSTDPFFPERPNVEWFLDFGNGTTAQTTSGKVAVSLRQNPNVKVRIMVWQFFPQNASLLLGNQYHEGSKQAVALADWKIRSHARGVVLERGSYQVVLHRADPADY
jgi:hypothetical protein